MAADQHLRDEYYLKAVLGILNNLVSSNCIDF